MLVDHDNKQDVVETSLTLLKFGTRTSAGPVTPLPRLTDHPIEPPSSICQSLLSMTLHVHLHLFRE